MAFHLYFLSNNAIYKNHGHYDVHNKRHLFKHS